MSKPSKETFNKWLANKYDTECVGDECVHGRTNHKVIDRNLDDYFLINKMGVKLEDEEGRLFLIEGVGILGTFVPFTFKPI